MRSPFCQMLDSIREHEIKIGCIAESVIDPMFIERP